MTQPQPDHLLAEALRQIAAAREKAVEELKKIQGKIALLEGALTHLDLTEAAIREAIKIRRKT